MFRPPGERHQYLLTSVTSSILDALAAFEAEAEDLEWDPAEAGVADHDALAEINGGVL